MAMLLQLETLAARLRHSGRRVRGRALQGRNERYHPSHQPQPTPGVWLTRAVGLPLPTGLRNQALREPQQSLPLPS